MPSIWRWALDYVGHGYYERHRTQLKALALDDLEERVGRGPIEPSAENVARGIYPLALPLFIYMDAKRAERAEMKRSHVISSARHVNWPGTLARSR